jgi:hypothetical protein
MASYNIENLSGLVNKINKIPKKVNAVTSNVLNRSATFAITKSIDEILDTNNLKRDYVRGKFKRTKRASPNNLSSTITASDRRTLLARYPFSKTQGGVSVNVRRGATKVIKGGFIVRNLRGSFATGIAVTNKDFVSYLETSKTKSGLRPAKLSGAKSTFAKKPKGWTVLHGASINQMFDKNRARIKEPLKRFMIKEFFKELRTKL